MKKSGIVYIVDDDAALRRWLGTLLVRAGLHPHPFACGEDLLASIHDLPPGCVLLDVKVPGLDGIEILRRLVALRPECPVIAMGDHSEVRTAVAALKNGAFDYLEKPFIDRFLLHILETGFERLTGATRLIARRNEAMAKVGRLSPREREVLEALFSGLPNKGVARLLKLSPRTIEMFRASIMRKLEVTGLADMLRIAGEAGVKPVQPSREAA